MAEQLIRFEDWPERLAAFLEAAAERPFSWANWNCCIFVCAAVEAMTGKNPAEFFTIDYSDKETALRAMYRFGGGNAYQVAEAIAAEYAAPLVPVTKARRGDVVFLDHMDLTSRTPGGSIGIVDLTARNVCFLAPDGLARAPTLRCLHAWQVG